MIVFVLLSYLDGSTQAGELRRSSTGGLLFGPLEIALDLPVGWALLPDVSEVQAILDAEGVQNPAVFAIKSAKGAYIYGTYGEFSNFAISPREIAGTPPPQSMVEGWGLVRQEVEIGVIELPCGLEAALMRAKGSGSGRDFISSRDVSTVGVWIDIPYVYSDQDSLRSGLASLFFRSPESIAEAGALDVFSDLVEGTRPQNQYSSVSIQEFLLWVEEGSAGRQAQDAVAELQQDPGDRLTAGHLSAWVDDAFRIDAEEAPSKRLDLLKSLARQFPANPYLQSELLRFGSLWRETQLVGRFLTDDQNGQKRVILEKFHRLALEQQLGHSGQSAAREYLAYLNQVWPGNPIGLPPQGELEEGASWAHPLLGLEMTFLKSASGSFWISRTPVLEYLRSVEAASSEGLAELSQRALSWSEACRLAEAFDLRLPRPEQYQALAQSGRVEPSATRMYWASGGEGSRWDPAVKISPDSGVDSAKLLRKKRGSELAGGDAYMVLPDGLRPSMPCSR